MKKNHGRKFPERESSQSSDSVRPKKHLGQHFLRDENVARKIAGTLEGPGYNHVLEIGPGMGVLTRYLLDNYEDVHVVEIDPESVRYLRNHFPELEGKVHEKDFLTCEVDSLIKNDPFAIIGNFPYNISSQIVFRMLDLRHRIPEFSGMFQKEVALRICAKEGNKTYGILSVLVQAFYEAEYLFSVPPSVFNPPPKVESGVLRLQRKNDFSLPCNEVLFFRVVKLAFQQRRKTLRNSLKSFGLPENVKEDSIFGMRPEQLSSSRFVELTQIIELHAV